MRIAFVTGGLKLGGSTIFLLNLAGELNARGVSNLVLSFEEEHPLAPDFEARKIQVIRQHQSRDVFEDRMSAILSELKKFSPTHVVACLGPESFEVLRYVPEGVARLGMVQSDDPLVYQTVSSYASFLDATIGVSRKTTHTLQSETALQSLRAHYLPYGVQVSMEQFIRTENAQDPLRVIYLGRLDQEQKRVRLLPVIREQLNRAGVSSWWTIAGDGPERSFLEREMRTGAHEAAISFPGVIAYDEVPHLLQKHDIFLLPSIYEGLPLSLLEAMAAGAVPVVSDLASGMREVVDETNGILVQPENTDGYAAGIAELHHNRLLLREKARNARDRILDGFSSAAMTDRWLAALASHKQQIATWPALPRILAPMTASHPLLFSSAGRVLRRLSKRVSRFRLSPHFLI
jgi:glycosyltransferase involved in cell wall biosynthesis